MQKSYFFAEYFFILIFHIFDGCWNMGKFFWNSKTSLFPLFIVFLWLSNGLTRTLRRTYKGPVCSSGRHKPAFCYPCISSPACRWKYRKICFKVMPQYIFPRTNLLLYIVLCYIQQMPVIHRSRLNCVL